jgi:hypothetical protein
LEAAASVDGSGGEVWIGSGGEEKDMFQSF